MTNRKPMENTCACNIDRISQQSELLAAISLCIQQGPGRIRQKRQYGNRCTPWHSGCRSAHVNSKKPCRASGCIPGNHYRYRPKCSRDLRSPPSKVYQKHDRQDSHQTESTAESANMSTRIAQTPVPPYSIHRKDAKPDWLDR